MGDVPTLGSSALAPGETLLAYHTPIALPPEAEVSPVAPVWLRQQPGTWQCMETRTGRYGGSHSRASAGQGRELPLPRPLHLHAFPRETTPR